MESRTIDLDFKSVSQIWGTENSWGVVWVESGVLTLVSKSGETRRIIGPSWQKSTSTPPRISSGRPFCSYLYLNSDRRYLGDSVFILKIGMLPSLSCISWGFVSRCAGQTNPICSGGEAHYLIIFESHTWPAQVTKGLDITIYFCFVFCAQEFR